MTRVGFTVAFVALASASAASTTPRSPSFGDGWSPGRFDAASYYFVRHLEVL